MQRHKFVSPLAEPCSVVCDVCFLQAVIYREKIRGAKAIFAISDACFLQALVEVWTAQRTRRKNRKTDEMFCKCVFLVWFVSISCNIFQKWPGELFQRVASRNFPKVIRWIFP